ncbi:phage tail tape measure protein [Methylocaldum sp. MU1018]
MSTETNSLQDRLSTLNRQQRQLAAFKNLEVSMNAKSRALREARDRADALRRALASTAAPTNAQTRAMQRAEAQVRRLAQQHNALRMRYLEQRPVMERMGIDTGNLSGAESRLRERIAATNAELNRRHEILRRGESIRASGAAMARAGTAATALGMGSRAALTPAVAAFSDQEDAATQLKVSMMRDGGAVSANFEQINALAERLGTRLPGTTSQLQAMMTTLIQQGASEKAILGGLGEASANIGVLLKKPFQEAAEFASKLQDATGTTEDQMMGLMDTIQRTFFLGVDSENMLAGMTKLSPAMDILKKKGLEAAQAFAPLLIMADQAGMQGEAAGNAYRKIFQAAMNADGKVSKVNKALREEGFSVRLDFTNGKGEFGGIDKLFVELGKLRRLDTQTRLGALKGIFGDDAETLQAVTLLIEKGQAGYANVQAKMSAQASIQERVNAQLGTLTNLWEAATGTFTSLTAGFVAPIANELKALTDWLTEAQERFGAWMKDHPGIARALAITVFGFAALTTVLGGLLIGLATVTTAFGFLYAKLAWLGPVLGIIRTAAVAALPALMGVLAGLKTAVMGAAAFLMANPIVAVIGAIVAAVAGLAYLIYRNWDWLSTKFGEIWAKIAQACSSGWANLAQWWNGVVAGFADIGTRLVDGLIGGIRSRWEGLKAAVADLARALPDPVRKVLDIHSPSRVFAELGRQMVGGLALGVSVAAPEALAAVAAVGARLPAEVPAIHAAVALSDLPRAMPSGSSNGLASAGAGGAHRAAAIHTDSNIMINVYPSPGMDEQALAELVAKQLRDHERRAASAARARLYDRD